MTAQRTTRLTSLPGTTTSLTTSLPSRKRATFSLALGEAQQLVLRSVGGSLDAIAQLAVDLDDERHGLAAEQGRVGLGPGLLPDPAALQALPDLGAQVRREGEDQRGRGRRREADRRGPLGSS